MSEPLVSVIVPIYNTEKYLSECVESIIHQSYENLEIILVDDGATDKCPQMCDEYALKDPRVRVIHKINGGLSSARKAGISESNGKYLMIVDSDDWIDSETIEKCVEVAEKDCSECVLFSYVKEYGNKSISNYLFDKSFCYGEQEAEDKIHRRIIGFRKEELQHPERIDNLSTICGKMYTEKTVKKGRIISEREVGTSEDTIFNIYALDGCTTVSYIHQCFYHYRRTNIQSATMRYKPDLYPKWKCMYLVFAEYLCRSGNEKKYQEEFLNRIACGVIGLGLNEANAQHSIFKKSRNLKIILEDSLYKNAFLKLDTSYCPIKWKIFFGLCKKKYTFFLAIMLEMINYIRLKHQ